MDIKLLLQLYTELENRVEKNFELIKEAYNLNRELLNVTVESWGEVFVNTYETHMGESDYAEAYIPIDWFESDEILIEKLNKKIKNDEEYAITVKMEKEKENIKKMKDKIAEMQKVVDEYEEAHKQNT